MSQSYDCIASIVVYDTPLEIVENTLESFLNTGLRVKAYIADNSDSGSYKSLSHHQNTGYIQNENIGYGKANNQVFSAIEETEFFLVLNPDVVIQEDTLQNLLEFMRKDPSIGLASVMILNPDGTIQGSNKRLPTLFVLLLRRLLPGTKIKFLKKFIDYYEMRDFPPYQNYEVPFLSGSFLCFRKEIFKEAGGFDERYFLYFEDADICRRVREKGYKTLYFSESKITHLWKRATHNSWKITYVFIKSMISYFNRWGWKLIELPQEFK